MNDNFDENGLAEWLRDKAPEFSCALAARTALRTTPILHDVLGEDAAARRTSIVLPCFRALAAANFATTYAHGRTASETCGGQLGLRQGLCAMRWEKPSTKVR